MTTDDRASELTPYPTCHWLSGDTQVRRAALSEMREPARIGQCEYMTRGPIVKAMAIVRRPADGALLVSEGRDPHTGLTFQRPLGGSVEFGERAIDAIGREFREELDRELINIRYVGVIENVFDYDGDRGHEIVLVFVAEFADAKAYDFDQFDTHDSENPDLHVVWQSATDDLSGLVPVGIERYL